MSFIINIKPNKELFEILEEKKKTRLAKGYPKIGTILTAIKSGNPALDFPDGIVTKDKKYEVIDNGDYQEGYYHVMGDIEWCFVCLTPYALKEFFGVEYNE